MSLQEQLAERTASARASGHLESIPTHHRTFERDGVRWVIRMAAELVKKKRKVTSAPLNPFLPYDPELYVSDAGDHHVYLLNKFNVVDHHLLIVTRHFEDQRALLTESDFAALDACLQEIDGLAFYNAGRAAGASQKHKHLQLVPRVDPEVEGVPIEPLLERLPFLFATERRVSGASDLFARYRAMMQRLEVDPRAREAIRTEAREPPLEGPGERQPFPYDLLMTRRWLLIVPRTEESVGGIQINSLGYSGAFLAKTDEERRRIEADPLELLARAAAR